MLGRVCLLALAALMASPDLEIMVGREEKEVGSRTAEGQLYYKLEDIVDILDLEFDVESDQLVLQGPRGTLLLTHGRRLVGYADQYILISVAPWQRRKNDWYVPQDFIDRALPYILSTKLERVADRRYRIADLEQNQVQVEVTNYPDHVSIVFAPSKRSRVDVQEFRRYLQVEFDEYLVRPDRPERQPDPRLVSSLEFNPNDVFGVFRIHKGSNFYTFRHFTLTDPLRTVINIYAPPQSDRVAGGLDIPPPPRPDAAGLDVIPAHEAPSASARVEEGLIAAPPTRPRYAVTIDPGHGGPNSGVTPAEGVTERDIVLSIAQNLDREFSSSGLTATQTRRRDSDLPLERRSALVNYYQSRAFISLHAGGSPSPEAAGPIVYVHQDLGGQGEEDSQVFPSGLKGQARFRARSRELAELVQAELNAVYGSKNQVVEAPLTVLAPVTAPAVLVEVGFLTNEDNRPRLISADFQRRLAEALARAVSKFLR